jgi:hypothetical protein
MIRRRDVTDLLARSRPAWLEPPPDKVTEPYRAVSAVVSAAGDPAPEGVPSVGRRRRPRRRLALLVAVGATAAVVAVVGLAVAPGDPSGPAGSGQAADPPSGAAPADPGPLLLAAAERAAADVGEGRYRTLRTEYGFAVPVDAATGRYLMIQRTVSQYWLARPGVGASWVITQSLGASPATAADADAWRNAGSPTVMTVATPKPMELSTAPGKVYGNTVDQDQLFGVGDRPMSQADLDALPTEPAALRDMLLSGFHGGGGDEPTDRDQWLRLAVTGLITDMPITTGTRAAAFRLLAGLPGVSGLGTVTDLRGRSGQAVAFTEDNPKIGSFEVRLIIDPSTGRALGQERRAVRPAGPRSFLAPGAISTYQLVLDSGTTDDDPPTVDVVT